MQIEQPLCQEARMTLTEKAPKGQQENGQDARQITTVAEKGKLGCSDDQVGWCQDEACYGCGKAMMIESSERIRYSS
ncbi:MAG: hypothetical protein KGJ40_05555, partial [candidate division NC10 bacterium]|nr:hypothetical protein [candidate division NC10 bacterium]